MPQPSDPPGLNLNPPPRHEVHRLFFALWPDAALRRRIANATTRLAESTHGRRLRPERYHLTLQFLGDFDPLPLSLVDDAVAAAGEVQIAAFELALDRAGGFGGTRVGWLGPGDAPAGLQALWHTLGLALAGHGVPSSMASTFTPHVTVLRHLRHPLAMTAIPPLPWSVDEFVLVHSRPGQGDYALLRHWPLQA